MQFGTWFNSSLMAALLGTLTQSATWAMGPEEIRDTKGSLKKSYQSAWDNTNNLSHRDLKDFARRSKKAFNGDNALSPMPRILKREEMNFLKRAVEQRAKALRAFLIDHHSGQRSYLRAGVIPEQVIRRALIRSGEFAFEGQIDPNKIVFVYGPDLVRARYDGQVSWYVLEDNIGNLGGLGDIVLAQSLILSLHPQLPKAYQFSDPLQFYKDLARRLSEQAAQNNGAAVVYRSPGRDWDHDPKRFNDLMASLGVITISGQSDKKLFTENGALYLKSKDSFGAVVKQKVGALFLNDELSWTDSTHPAMQIKYVLDLARDFMDLNEVSEARRKEVIRLIGQVKAEPGDPSIKRLLAIMQEDGFLSTIRSRVPGLTEAILSGAVTSSSTPGTGFLDDKELLPYVESMIRFYLGEEPLLRSPPGFSLVDPRTGRFQKEKWANVLANPGNWVIKRFDGRGGKTTWVGEAMSQEEFTQVQDQVREDPSSYGAQVKVELSRLNGRSTDLRAFAYVTPDSILVGDVPFSRIAGPDTAGKVNLSSGGEEVAVLVINKNAKSCPDFFLESEP